MDPHYDKRELEGVDVNRQEHPTLTARNDTGSHHWSRAFHGTFERWIKGIGIYNLEFYLPTTNLHYPLPDYSLHQVFTKLHIAC